MKPIIVYESIHHQNTRKVAEAIAGVLGAKLVRAGEADPEEIGKCGLVGFGSGIYFGRHHKSLLEFAEKLIKVTDSFIFSTRGAPSLGNFHSALKKILKAKGGEDLGEFSCTGWDTFGPLLALGGIAKGRPNGEDLANAREFAKKLVSQLP
jgi:flavodoxin